MPGEAPAKKTVRTWPTGQEVGSARGVGLGYGSGQEGFVDGSGSARMVQFDGLPSSSISRVEDLAERERPTMVSGAVSDALAQAFLASNRSAVASLGFEPRRAAAITGVGDLNVNGSYSPRLDRMVNFTNNPSTYTHEAAHRGLEKMRAAGLPVDQNLPMSGEETWVRHLMRSTMGDPETGDIASEHRQKGDPNGNLAKSLKLLEGLAAKEIARRRPGGPR